MAIETIAQVTTVAAEQTGDAVVVIAEKAPEVAQSFWEKIVNNPHAKTAAIVVAGAAVIGVAGYYANKAWKNKKAAAARKEALEATEAAATTASTEEQPN